MQHYVKVACSSYVAGTREGQVPPSQSPAVSPILHTALLTIAMQTPTFASLLLIAGLCHAQGFPNYVQIEGNRSSPNSVPPGVRNTLEQADNSPNASHTVSFSSPGYDDWDWTLQLSDVSVPAISNSTPDAHVAFTTWHFSRAGERPSRADRPGDWPFCAYLMDIDFPYNVSSQWKPDNSSCVPALGEECASALGAVALSSDCDSGNVNIPGKACAGMLSGGPVKSYGITTQGYGTSGPMCWCFSTALTDSSTLSQRSTTVT